jgi:hypothetical protein
MIVGIGTVLRHAAILPPVLGENRSPASSVHHVLTKGPDVEDRLRVDGSYFHDLAWGGTVPVVSGFL